MRSNENNTPRIRTNWGENRTIIKPKNIFIIMDSLYIKTKYEKCNNSVKIVCNGAVIFESPYNLPKNVLNLLYSSVKIKSVCEFMDKTLDILEFFTENERVKNIRKKEHFYN